MQKENKLIQDWKDNLIKNGVFSKIKQQHNDAVTIDSFENYCKIKEINKEDCLKQIEFISKIVSERIQSISYGENYINSLTLIEPFNSDNKLIHEFLPEFCHQSQKILLSSELKNKKNLIITKNNNLKGMKLKENLIVDINFENKVVTLMLKADEALKIGSDCCLDQTWHKYVDLLKKIRQNFYTNLFEDSGKKFEKLKEKGLYKGGLTADSQVNVALEKRISKDDLMKIISHLDGYLRDDFVIVLHSETLKQLKEDDILDHYYKEPYFHKIPIIGSDLYPYKIDEEGKWNIGDKPVAVFSKRSMVAYGLDILIYDVYKKEGNFEINDRVFKTVGELKLCDPFLYARYLEFKNK